MGNENESLPQRYFHDASAQEGGITFTRSADDCRAFQNGLNYWHENYMRWHDGDPDYPVL